MSAITIAVAIATPVLAFLGVLVGQFVARRGDKEADQWRRREETMRLLRWAVESAASDNLVLSEAGLSVLDELADAELLQPQDRTLVAAVTEVSVELPARWPMPRCLTWTTLMFRRRSKRRRAMMAETPTMPKKAEKVIKVTPRQIRAAQISVKAHQRLGKPVPPGLQRIADVKRAS